MSVKDEAALLKYILNGCGDKEAVDAVKSCDPESFSAYATKQAMIAVKHEIGRGVWPTKENVLSGLDPVVSIALEAELEQSKDVFDPGPSLDAIRAEYARLKAMDILARAYAKIKDGNIGIDSICQELQSVNVRQDGWEVRDFADVLSDIEAGNALSSAAQRNLLVTGIETIDKALASPPGSYGVVGAMPGVGKTSLLFQIAVLSAMSDARVFAMSLETPKSTLEAKAAASFFSSQGGAAYTNSLLKKGGYNFHHQYQKLGRDRLLVGFHPAGLAFPQLEAKIRVMADKGYNVFLIDYFSLLEPADLKNKSEHSKTAEMSKAVKALAATLQVHITFVVQPNAEGKYGDRPDPSQLATSKQVFRDYDFGLYLWSEREKNEQYQTLNGNHLKLLKAWLHKNRLFNSDDTSIKSEPEVYVEAELRRNWFKEIAEPALTDTGLAQANRSRSFL